MGKYLVYGLIPARGGSEGLPGKNAKSLRGQPLISYIIRSALFAKELNSVFVSTDSEKIARIAEKSGVEAIIHPAEFSTPTAPTFGVVRNAVGVLKKRGVYPDVMVTMRPTSPLCLPEDINRAVRLLLRQPRIDSVISVTKSDNHPFRVLKINQRGELEHFDKRSTERNFPKRRQSFGDVYVRNGAIYATRTHIIESGSLWGEHSLPYFMPKERSVKINDEIDFLLAESLLTKSKDTKSQSR